MIGADRMRDVLQILLTEIRELHLDLAADLIVNDAADADAARIGDAFEPGSNVDAVPQDVVSLYDNVPEVDTDAELDPPVLRQRCFAFGGRTLDRNSTSHRINDTWELHQQPVAGGLHDAPTV